MKRLVALLVAVLMLAGCSPYVIPNNLDPAALKGQGIIVISTGSDSLSASFASCMVIKASVDNGDKGHCLMLDASMAKSDFADHHGHLYVLPMNPGSYEASLYFMNPYFKYTTPHVADFDLRPGQVLYMGEAYLVHGDNHANHVKVTNQYDRDMALLRQHDPALIPDVQVQLLESVSDPAERVHLPLPPNDATSLFGQDYRLHVFMAKDATGHALGDVPATLVGILNNKGDWDDVSPEEVPAFSGAIPDALRGQVALFYNKHTHWVVAPRGWKLAIAEEGADATLMMTFVAPTGVKDGWMRVFDISTCVSCMYTAADGIIPRAHEALSKSNQRYTAEPILTPWPQSLVPTSACVALLQYQLPSSPPVSGAVYLQTDDSDMASIYVALPDSQSTLSKYIADNFLNTHSKCGD